MEDGYAYTLECTGCGSTWGNYQSRFPQGFLDAFVKGMTQCPNCKEIGVVKTRPA